MAKQIVLLTSVASITNSVRKHNDEAFFIIVRLKLVERSNLNSNCLHDSCDQLILSRSINVGSFPNGLGQV